MVGTVEGIYQYCRIECIQRCAASKEAGISDKFSHAFPVFEYKQSRDAGIQAMNANGVAANINITFYYKNGTRAETVVF